MSLGKENPLDGEDWIKVVDHEINPGKGLKYTKEGISEFSKLRTNWGTSGLKVPEKMVLNKEIGAREEKSIHV